MAGEAGEDGHGGERAAMGRWGGRGGALCSGSESASAGRLSGFGVVVVVGGGGGGGHPSPDLRVLLSVLACPLSPVPVLPRHPRNVRFAAAAAAASCSAGLPLRATRAHDVVRVCRVVQVASSAQYILEQFRATTGCGKIEGAAKSMYAAGRVRMAMAPEPGIGIGIGIGGGGGGAAPPARAGCTG